MVPFPQQWNDNCFFPGRRKYESKEGAIDYLCQYGKDALIQTLSGPIISALFEGKECSILRISEEETG